ncbi:MAG: carboxypeptidase regulatory-like domain-containing protein [Calditrichaeota bacterium]|nr:MAG: carboxypeptidase regulatory-like domain-containing protein [Calditrichota bacterium]
METIARMRHRFGVIAALSLIFLSISFSAGKGATTGIISGKVLNGSLNGQPVVQQDVVLYKVQDGQDVDEPRPHAITDSQGKFVFENLDIAPGVAYYPLTFHETIRYTGPMVTLQPDAAQQQSDITVFETTESDSAIVAEMHHVVVDLGDGSLSVQEVYSYKNPSKYALFRPAPSKPELKIGLQYALPKGARALQFGGDLMNCCVVVDGNRVLDTMEFKPGPRQVVLSYELPIAGKALRVIKPIMANTQSLDVYLPPGVDMGSLFLTQDGKKVVDAVSVSAENPQPFQIRGKSYTRYEIPNIQKGAMFNLALDNLPTKPWNLKWIAPVALAVLIAISLLLSQKRKRALEPSAVDTSNPHTTVAMQWQAKIDQVIQLDEDFELGQIDPSRYEALREQLLSEIVSLAESDPAHLKSEYQKGDK